MNAEKFQVTACVPVRDCETGVSWRRVEFWVNVDYWRPVELHLKHVERESREDELPF